MYIGSNSSWSIQVSGNSRFPHFKHQCPTGVIHHHIIIIIIWLFNYFAISYTYQIENSNDRHNYLTILCSIWPTYCIQSDLWNSFKNDNRDCLHIWAIIWTLCFTYNLLNVLFMLDNSLYDFKQFLKNPGKIFLYANFTWLNSSYSWLIFIYVLKLFFCSRIQAQNTSINKRLAFLTWMCRHVLQNMTNNVAPLAHVDVSAKCQFSSSRFKL